MRSDAGRPIRSEGAGAIFYPPNLGPALPWRWQQGIPVGQAGREGSWCRIKLVISDRLRGSWRGWWYLGLDGILEDGADEMVVEGEVLVAKGQEAELVEVGLAQLLGQEAVQVAEVAVRPIWA